MFILAKNSCLNFGLTNFSHSLRAGNDCRCTTYIWHIYRIVRIARVQQRTEVYDLRKSFSSRQKSSRLNSKIKLDIANVVHHNSLKARRAIWKVKKNFVHWTMMTNNLNNQCASPSRHIGTSHFFPCAFSTVQNLKKARSRKASNLGCDVVRSYVGDLMFHQIKTKKQQQSLLNYLVQMCFCTRLLILDATVTQCSCHCSRIHIHNPLFLAPRLH